MNLLFVADLHGNRILYESVLRRASKPDIDGIIFGGDLCPRGGTTLKEWVAFQRSFLEDYLIEELRSFRATHPQKQIFIIMGNDDFRKNADVLENWHLDGIAQSIHMKKAEVDGIFLVGYSFVNTTPFRLKDWEKKDSPTSIDPPQLTSEVLRSCEEEKGTIEEDLSSLKSLSDPKKTIYAIHVPPFNTKLDIIQTGDHVGSASVLNFIKSEQPLATFHGHIHESPKMSGSWKEMIGATLCVNVGSRHSNDILPCCIIDTKKPTLAKYEELSVL